MNSMVRSTLERTEKLLNTHTQGIRGALIICGLMWRLYHAGDFYTNPDEALHYCGSWPAAWIRPEP